MTTRQTLTVIAIIREGCEGRLRNLLNTRGDELLNGDASIDFNGIQTVHFARWVIVAGGVYRNVKVPTRLVFCSNYDGPLHAQLEDLASRVPAALDEIYELCEGYPKDGNRTTQSRMDFLKHGIVGNDAIFIGTPDRTVRQIRQEDELRIALQKYLDQYKSNGKSALEVKRALCDYVFSEKGLVWAKAPPPPRESTWFRLTLFLIAALFLWPLAVLWLIVLRLFFERTDKPLNMKPCDLDPTLVKELERREDIIAQSPFSQLMELKHGRFRFLTIRGVLWLSNFVGRNIFKNGNIMFIPSIHFYAWIILPEGRLLFLSNFAGSWQNYLGDFINKAAFGLNGVLSNCVGFPKTWFLFLKGVYDVEHYKAWARWANIPTQVFYSAYPGLNVKNINNNSKIRAGLFQDMDEEASVDWLRRM
jgi:hypothetical protein